MSKMATFFGEVITHPSRAVDDDEDECDETQSHFPEPQLQWTPEVQRQIYVSSTLAKKLKCKLLVIGTGPAATVGFLEAYILWNGADVVATIDCDPSRSEVRPESAAGHRTCSVYRLKQKPSVLVCQCRSEMMPEITHVCTEKIFSSLDTSDLEVIVMDTSPAAEYRTHLPFSELSAPFLKSLKSSKHKAKTVSAPLEAPNVIKGLSAAVLSHCQVFSLSCAVYIGFMDSLFLHTDDIKVFMPVLSQTSVKSVFQENPNADAVLKKFVERRALQGSLYT